MFLGANSAYVTEGATTAGLSTSYTSGTIGGKTYAFAGGDVTTGVVSVGSTTGTRRIQNVAPGLISDTSTDAVNGSQLKAVVNAVDANTTEINNIKTIINNNDDVNEKINELRGDINEAGAKSAALAALKPMSYDPMEPTQIMAGMGGYRSSHAMALDVAHYANESTMFNAGLSIGEHETMYNAGVTWKIGHRSAESAIADRYKAGPISSVYVLQDEMTAMKAENAGLVAKNEALSQQNEAQNAKIERMQAQIDALLQRVGM